MKVSVYDFMTVSGGLWLCSGHCHKFLQQKNFSSEDKPGHLLNQ